MHGSAGPEDRFPPANAEGTTPSTGAVQGPSRNQSNGSVALAEKELQSALQLLVERAQYITGATGTALALPQGEEMVCRASAGASAPAVGARLQVRSGLTGESIARRQLLRCDNAEADPRVNLEACRALGIASIVVLPLLRKSGEIRGLFELFSDHPYAFEERDLIALERMADLTLTALDLAEQRPHPAPAPALRPGLDRRVESPAASRAREVAPAAVPPTEIREPAVDPSELELELRVRPQVVPASVPEAMLRVQKCDSCGFPVSEGRTLCLDCEKKASDKKDNEKKQREKAQIQVQHQQAGEEKPTSSASFSGSSTGSVADPGAPMAEESVPAFLAAYATSKESWMANHVNLLAIVVLIVGILLAVVVFR
jgi:putative methionine-R-sulfoxide reductase with GAF domain/uncharacterized Zn finger protein (UPF0148 family)